MVTFLAPSLDNAKASRLGGLRRQPQSTASRRSAWLAHTPKCLGTNIFCDERSGWVFECVGSLDTAESFKNDSFADKIITTSVSLHRGHLEGTDKGWQTWIRARTDWENHYSLPCFPWTDPDGQSLHRKIYVYLIISPTSPGSSRRFQLAGVCYWRRTTVLLDPYEALIMTTVSSIGWMCHARGWHLADHTHIQGAYHTHV